MASASCAADARTETTCCTRMWPRRASRIAPQARGTTTIRAGRFGMIRITALAPVTARMLSALVRAGAAMVGAVVIGYLFGFRFSGGVGAVAVFVGLALLLSLALSLGADALGSLAGSTEEAGQTLLIPQLLLVMLSTGIAPAEAFPSWLGPFVRHQPVSVIAETLRGLAIGEYRHLALSLTWCAGLLVAFGAIAVRMQGR